MLEEADPAHGITVWHMGDVRQRAEGAQAILSWNGSYGNDFTGGYEIHLDDAGDIEFGYLFTYSGPGLTAREIGLEFDLPLDFDRLNWDRPADRYGGRPSQGRPDDSARHARVRSR